MILADTSIVINFWRHPEEQQIEAARSFDAAVCGATVAELYAGCRGEQQRIRCSAPLSAFLPLPTPEDLWQKLGTSIYEMRVRGLTVPFQDALIASVAMYHDVPLWSVDRHFERLRGVFPNLRLFDPTGTWS